MPKETAANMTKMQCWAIFSDGHGLVLHSPVWLPEGDFPEDQNNYERIYALDYDRDAAYPFRLEFKHETHTEIHRQLADLKKVNVRRL